MLAVVLVGLSYVSVHYRGARFELTYKRRAAVVASGNLGLVGVDKDLGVAVGAAAAIADNDTIMSPLNGLLVNHLHCGEGLRLRIEISLFVSQPASSPIPRAKHALGIRT